MSKRIHIFTEEDVLQHASSSDCWVMRNGKVYNVTRFLPDHPGGDDVLLEHAGKDVGAVMKDPDVQEHSAAAYDMLEEYLIGRVGSNATVVSDDWVPDENFHPEDTDSAADYEKNEFLDLRKPLLKQLWYANFSKRYYLQQVHQPRHLATSARLFGPSYLEVFSVTPWYVVPTVWLPVTGYLLLRGLLQWYTPIAPFTVNPFLPLSALASVPADALAKTLLSFLFGNVVWTILEYTLHRFLFHIDDMLPDHPKALTVHFLLHGVHHYLPMDRLRLVMPPLMFFALSFPFTRLAHLLFPAAMANSVIAGSYTFYVLYDCMHYALHHTQLPAYMREMKKYHLAHHYKNFELGFGVTSKIWDYVFNTVLPV